MGPTYEGLYIIELSNRYGSYRLKTYTGWPVCNPWSGPFFKYYHYRLNVASSFVFSKPISNWSTRRILSLMLNPTLSILYDKYCTCLQSLCSKLWKLNSRYYYKLIKSPNKWIYIIQFHYELPFIALKGGSYGLRYSYNDIFYIESFLFNLCSAFSRTHVDSTHKT